MHRSGSRESAICVCASSRGWQSCSLTSPTGSARIAGLAIPKASTTLLSEHLCYSVVQPAGGGPGLIFPLIRLLGAGSLLLHLCWSCLS
jgi:hypothetical protein